jgi:phenylacetaldehyde dehydrogenase
VNAVPQHTIAAQPAPSAAVSAFLKRAPRLLIGGEWVESKSQGRIPVLDPATGKEIASVVDANASDVDRAVAAARAAFEKGPWANMLPADRERLLWKLSDLIDQNADELAELESLNNGKTKFMASTRSPRSRTTRPLGSRQAYGPTTCAPFSASCRRFAPVRCG